MDLAKMPILEAESAEIEPPKEAIQFQQKKKKRKSLFNGERIRRVMTQQSNVGQSNVGHSNSISTNGNILPQNMSEVQWRW
mmetsp:Transcript_26808/g.57566  ORF Transcript_26808/g.57566 Transcript_26808/m.57566 type:complete len:81 (+) Transcript_26808:62-304(+)